MQAEAAQEVAMQMEDEPEVAAEMADAQEDELQEEMAADVLL